MHQQELHTSNTTVKPFVLPMRTPQEYSRLAFQHHALRLGLEKNFLASCAHPTAILDVACGCGTWTAEMGKLFPNASIIGMDLRMPTYPQSSGFQFVQGHTPSALPFHDARFDYVHQRCLGTVIPTVHWQGIVDELVRVTRPGGWVELGEYGSYVSGGPATQQFCLWWQEVLAKQGIDLKLMDSLSQLLLNAGGLEHVQQQTLPIPLSGGRAGYAMRTNLLAVIQNAKANILALGVDQNAFDRVVDALPKEWQAYKTTYQFHAAYGQREGHKTLLGAAGHRLAQHSPSMHSSQWSHAHKVQTVALSHA